MREIFPLDWPLYSMCVLLASEDRGRNSQLWPLGGVLSNRNVLFAPNSDQTSLQRSEPFDSAGRVCVTLVTGPVFPCVREHSCTWCGPPHPHPPHPLAAVPADHLLPVDDSQNTSLASCGSLFYHRPSIVSKKEKSSFLPTFGRSLQKLPNDTYVD